MPLASGPASNGTYFHYHLLIRIAFFVFGEAKCGLSLVKCADNAVPVAVGFGVHSAPTITEWETLSFPPSWTRDAFQFRAHYLRFFDYFSLAIN